MTRLAPFFVLAAVAATVVGSDRREPVPQPLDAPAPRPLPFFYDLYSFRGDSGMTAVVASYAVDVGGLDWEHVEAGVRYRFNVTLVLADTATGGVARADDSVFVEFRRPLASEHLLHTHVETQARPSTTTVQRVIMFNAPRPGIGQLYTHPYTIPDYSGSALMLSDIALGLPDSQGGWKRGEATLALLPSSNFPGGLFDVYYEVYNLPRGNRYTTEIAVQPIPDSGNPVPEEPSGEGFVGARFLGEAAPSANGTVSELRRVNAPLAPGRHQLTVTVTDQRTGRTARRTRVLEVREWDEGATLVPTCPVSPGVDRTGCPTRPAAAGS